MQFDDLLVNYLGSCGKYQRRVYLLVCLPAAYCAFSLFCWTFTGADLPHRCKLSSNDSDYKIPVWERNVSVFMGVGAGEEESCRNPLTGQSCSHGYVWDQSEITNSAAQDWELVCDRKWIKAVVQSLFYLGQMVGCALIGFLSDRYGRKIVLLVCTVAISAASLLSAFSPSVEVFAVYRFFQGALEPGVFQVPFVIGIELVGPSKRLSAGLLIQAFFTLGLIGLGGIAYFIRDWKTLQIVLSVPGFLFVSYYWLLPESARWLLAIGKKEESVVILKKAAKVNGVTLPEEVLDSLEDGASGGKDIPAGNQKRYGYFDLVRTPNLRKNTMVSSYCWIVVTFVYYGISLNPSAIAGDFYSSFILASVMELPALLLLFLFLDILGRRIIQCASFILAGVSVVSVLFVPLGIGIFLTWITRFAQMEIGSIVLMLASKLAITSAFCTVYIYTSEIFPTVVRNIGLGTAATFGRIGGILSPFASLFLGDNNRTVLLVFLGTSSVVAGILTLFLPETMNRLLPESLEDGEDFGKKASLFESPFAKKPPTDETTTKEKELLTMTAVEVA